MDIDIYIYIVRTRAFHARECAWKLVKLGSVQAVPGPLRRFNIRYIFKSWIHILLFFVSFFDELGALRSCSASHPL